MRMMPMSTGMGYNQKMYGHSHEDHHRNDMPYGQQYYYGRKK